MSAKSIACWDHTIFTIVSKSPKMCYGFRCSHNIAFLVLNFPNMCRLYQLVVRPVDFVNQHFFYSIDVLHLIFLFFDFSAKVQTNFEPAKFLIGFIFSVRYSKRVSEGTFRIICITHYHLINKNLKKLFSKVWHCVLCSAVVMNLVGRRLPPASYQHQNIFYRTSKLSRRKNSENREQSQVYLNYAEVHLSVSDVFAFTDFTA